MTRLEQLKQELAETKAEILQVLGKRKQPLDIERINELTRRQHNIHFNINREQQKRLP